MTMQLAKLYQSLSAGMVSWNTALDASDTTPKERLGAIRWDHHRSLGYRWFQYVRFDQSGGAVKDNPVSSRALISVTANANGTTTTIPNAAGLAANIVAGGLIRCLDDAGGAGAAPEGEYAEIVSNTTTLITIDSNDAFSAAVGNGDTFRIELPWAVIDSAAGDTAATCQGVALVTQPQFSYGWVQFAGRHPGVTCAAAGTAITLGKSLILGTNLVTNGSTSTAEVRVGYATHGVTTDTVLRKIPMNLCCGPAFMFGAAL